MIPSASNSARETIGRGFFKPLAMITALVMIISTVVLGQGFVAPESKAEAQINDWQTVISAVPSATGWFIGTHTGTNKFLDNPLTPMNDQMLYGVTASGRIFHWPVAADGTVSPYVSITTGNTPTGTNYSDEPRSTMAFDAGDGVRTPTAYFWDWNGGGGSPRYTTLWRVVGQGSQDVQGLRIPSPNNIDPSTARDTYPYYSGGEVDQTTGYIYLSDGECTGINESWSLVVVDPVNQRFKYSGRVEPATPQDNIFGAIGSGDGCGYNSGYVASDFAMDAMGNVYALVATNGAYTNNTATNQALRDWGIAPTSTPHFWLVRIKPGTGTNPWTYSLVVPVRNSDGTLKATHAVWGSAFLNGKFYYVGNGLQQLNVLNPISGITERVINSAPADVFDMASGQTAYVVDGKVYDDVNLNGIMDSGEAGVPGVTLGIYLKEGTTYTYMGKRVTDGSGEYSFIAGGKGEYIVRVVRPQIDGVNAVQTGASVSGGSQDLTAKCYNGDTKSLTGAPCYGALAMPAADPVLPEGFGAMGSNKATQPDQFVIYSTVTLTTNKELATANFGITARGSFGDSVAGPATIALGAPAHVYAADPASRVWFGTLPGDSYMAPSTTNSHSATDDGVFIESYAGGLVMQTVENATLAATRTYKLGATVSGGAADVANVTAWVTGAGNNTWSPTQKWLNTTMSGGEVIGDFQFQSSGTVSGTQTVQLRTDISTSAITGPTNTGSIYYDQTTAGTAPWATFGEIEDYVIKVADAVYRPAAKTTGGTGNFTVAGVSINSVGTTLKVGEAKGVSAGTQNLTAVSPSSDWTVDSIAVKDVYSGAILAEPSFTPSGNTVSFSYSATVGSDVIIEVTFARNPDPARSTLVLDKTSTPAGTNITATATVVDAAGTPLTNALVTFSKVSSDITLIGDVACRTDALGKCEIKVTSTVKGDYPNELSAKARVSGVDTNITGSPATVKFTAADVSYIFSSFTVTPVVNPADTTMTGWKTANGTDAYVGVLTVEDEFHNRIDDLALTRITFTKSSADVDIEAPIRNTGNGTYTVNITSETADSTYTVNAQIDTTAVGDGVAKPVPFQPGPPDPTSPCTTLTAVPPTRMVGEPSIVTAHITDAYCNPVKDVVVTFTPDKTDGVVPGVTMQPTDPAGNAVITVTSTIDQTVKVDAKILNSLGVVQSINNSPVSIVFEPGPFCATSSSFGVSITNATKTEVAADFVETWTGTLTARDCQNNLLPSLTTAELAKMDFRISDDTLVEVSSPIVNAGSGKYTVTYKTRVADDYIASLFYTNGGTPVRVGADETIRFVSGDPTIDPCVDYSGDTPPRPGTKISASPPSIAVKGQASITAHVTDAFCNPVPNLEVTFARVTPTSATFVDSKDKDNTNPGGDAVVKITDNTAEIAKVNASFLNKAGTRLTITSGAPAQVQFTVGKLDPDKSTFVVSITDPAKTQVVADGVESWTGTVTAMDSDDNLLVSLSDAELALLQFTVSDTVVKPSTVVNAGSGKYTVTYTSKVKGTYSVAAWFNDTTVKQIGTSQNITFVAGEGTVEPCVDDSGLTPARPGTNISASSASVGVGGTADITAHVTDKFCNPVENVEVTFSLVTPTNARFVGDKNKDTTVVDGDATVSITDNTAQIVRVNGSFVNSTGTVTIKTGAPAQVEFTVGTLDPAQSTFAVSITDTTKTQVVADDIQTWTGTITARDSLGNLLPSLTAAEMGMFDFRVDTTLLHRGTVTNAGGGKYTITYSTKVADDYDVSAYYNGSTVVQIGTDKTITFVAGEGTDDCVDDSGLTPPRPPTKISAYPLTVGVKGVSDITALVTDQYCNPVPNVEVTFTRVTPTDATFVGGKDIDRTGVDGKATVTITDNTAQIVKVNGSFRNSTGTVTIKHDAPAEVEFTVGTLDPDQSTFAVSITNATKTSVVANGTETWTGTVTARDNAGNLLLNLSAAEMAMLDFRVNSTLVTKGTVTNAGSGRYTMTYSTTVADDYTVSAYYNGSPVKQIGTDKIITFVEGDPTPDPCVDGSGSSPPRPGTKISANPASVGVTGKSDITAHVTDAYCNPVKNLEVTFTLMTPTNATFDGGVSKRPTDTSGDAKVTITDAKAELVRVNGSFVFAGATLTITSGAPAEVEFTAGTVDPNRSSFDVAITDTTKTQVVADGVQTWTGTLTAMDASGNLLPSLTTAELAKFDFRVNSTLVLKTTITNAGSGKYTVTYRTTVADSYTASLFYTETTTAVQVGTSKTITFVAGEPDDECVDNSGSSPARPPTKISSSTPSVGVTGTADITAHVTDAYCNPVPNVLVTFSLVTPTSATFVSGVSTGTTNASGDTKVTITDTKAEIAKVNGSFVNSTGTVMIKTGAPAQVEFTVGTLDPSKSSFVVSITDTTKTEVVADNVQTWTGKLTARDTNMNLLTNLSTTELAKFAWPVTPTGQVTVSTVENIGNGEYTVTYKTTKAGTYSASVTYNGTTIPEARTITFVPGPIDAGKSLVVVDPTRQVAGSPVKITVTVRDAYENVIPGLASSDFTITGTSAGLPNMTISGFQISAPGVYSWNDSTSEKVGTFTVTAIVKGVTVTQKPQVEFYVGGVCTTPSCLSRFEMVTNDALANGSATNSVRAYAFDAYGNPVSGASVVITDKTTGTLANKLSPMVNSGTTGADGTVTLTWTSNTPGVYSAEGAINGGVPPTGALTNIRFTVGNADPAKSELVVTPASPIAVGEVYTARVTVRDINGLLIEGVTVSFSLNPTVMETPTRAQFVGAGYCTTGADGTCYVEFSSKLVTTVDVHATLPVSGSPVDVGGNGSAVKASPQRVSFTAGPVCPPPTPCQPVDPANVTRVQVETDGAEANNSATNIAKVYAYDFYGNPVRDANIASAPGDTDLNTTVVNAKTQADGTSTIEYRSLVAGAHQAKVTINGVAPPEAISKTGAKTTDGTITLNFSTGAIANTSLSISPAGPQTVGSTYTVTATMKDASGNAVTGGVVQFSSIAGLTFSSNTCIGLASGTCSVTVSATAPGNYPVSATVNSVAVPNTVNAVFNVGAVTRAVVEVTTNGVLADGSTWNVAKVWAYDSRNNPVPGAAVSSTQIGGSEMTIDPAIPNTGTDGSTTIWYKSSTAGSFQATVIAGGVTATPSPITLMFAYGEVNASNSSWVITPTTPLTVGSLAANTRTATATLRDATNNLVQGAVATFAVNPAGPQWGGGTASCMTNASGTCSVTLSSTKAGTFAVTMSVPSGSVQTQGPPRVTAVSVVWNADEICSQAEGCQPDDPNLPPELRTRVVVSSDNAIANGSSRDEATVYAFDKYGNPVPAKIVLTTPNNPTVLTVPGAIEATNGEGSTVIPYTSRVAGAHTATVTVGGHAPVGSPITLNFISGTVCVVEAGCIPVGPGTDPSKQTRVEVLTNNQPVDGAPNIVKAFAHDMNGNPVSGVVVTFVKSVATDDLVIGASCTTDTTGTCTVNATTYVAGAHNAKASVAGTELTDHGSPVTLTFVAGGICIKEAGCVPDGPAKNDPTLHTRAEVLANYAKVTKSGITAEEKNMDQIGVYAFDKYGNPVSGAVFTLNGANATLRFAVTNTNTATVSSTATTSADIAKEYSIGVESQTVNVAIAGTALAPLQLTYLDAPVITSPTTGSKSPNRPLAVSGTASTVGNTVTVYEGTTVVCTATVVAGGTWTCNATLSDASHTLTAVKSSPDGAKTSEPSDPVTITVDTAAPDTPAITGPKPDKPIKDPVITITGTGDEEGNDITVKDKDGHVVCTTKVTATGTWSCTVTLPDGDFKVTATETDDVGNESPPSAPIEFTVDTVPPAKPEITGPKVTAPISNPSVTITGTGDEVGNDITVKDETGHVVCTTKVSATGTWACTVTMTDGDYKVTATETDKALNVSPASTPIEFTVDSTPTAPPLITGPTGAVPLREVNPPITGTGAEVGNKIIVKDSDGHVICEATVDSSLGWHCTPLTPLADGSHVLKATETDSAGNISNPSTGFTVDIDRTGPAGLNVKDSNGSKINGSVTDPTDVGQKVTVFDEGGVPVPGCINVTVSSEGLFDCTPKDAAGVPKPLAAGSKLTVVAYDQSGNESTPKALTVRALGIDITHATRYTGEKQVVSGYNFNPGETVSLVVNSAPYNGGTQVADLDGKVTFTFNVPNDFEVGSHTATLTGVDSGSVSASFTVIARVPTGGTSLPQAAFPLGMMLTGAVMALAGLWILPRARRYGKERIFS